MSPMFSGNSRDQLLKSILRPSTKRHESARSTHVRLLSLLRRRFGAGFIVRLVHHVVCQSLVFLYLLLCRLLAFALRRPTGWRWHEFILCPRTSSAIRVNERKGKRNQSRFHKSKGMWENADSTIKLSPTQFPYLQMTR